MEADIVSAPVINEAPEPTIEEQEAIEQEKQLRAELVETGTKVLELLDRKAAPFYDIKFLKNYVATDEETMRVVVYSRILHTEFIESLRSEIISLMNGGIDA